MNGSYNDKGGKNKGSHLITETSITRTNHLSITYAYDISNQDLGFNIKNTSASYESFRNKLDNKEEVRILIFGDSVCVGAGATGFVNIEPKLDTWFDLLGQAKPLHF